MMVDHDHTDLVGRERSGIQEGIKLGEEVLGVFTPGPAEDDELYLRSFCFQNRYGLRIGGIPGLVLMKPFKSCVLLQDVAAHQAFEDLIGSVTGHFIFRLCLYKDTQPDDDCDKE